MSLKTAITTQATYNAWANKTLIEYLQSKPEHCWYAEVPSSFNSLAKTLNHILATQEYWYAIITKTESNSTRYFDEDPDAREVFKALVRQSELMEKTIGLFTETALQEQIEVRAEWFTSNTTRFLYIQHVFNHSTYHRGQLITIGRNLGFTDAPMTDLNYMIVMRDTVAIL